MEFELLQAFINLKTVLSKSVTTGMNLLKRKLMAVGKHDNFSNQSIYLSPAEGPKILKYDWVMQTQALQDYSRKIGPPCWGNFCF